MSEQLASALFWLIILIPVGVFARQIQRVRRGTRRKFKGAILFFCYSILPVLAYTLVCLVLVGVEEFTKLSVITEGLARTLLLVVGVGLAEVALLTIIFTIAVWLFREPRGMQANH
jgi:uncharacterized membrane protein SirB2